MSKSLLNNLLRALKIATWVCIAVGAFLFYKGFTSQDAQVNQTMTYYSLVVIAVGYLCNFMVKKLPGMVHLEDKDPTDE